MAVGQTSSVDLHLDVNFDDGVARGRRAAVERAFRDAIRGGRLQAGAVVPSSRALAHDLGLGRSTVVEAYAQLVAEGYLVTRPGGSTAVAPGHLGPAAASASASASADEEAESPAVKVDLRPGLLDLGRTFPRTTWLRAARAVLNQAPDAAFDYGDPRGAPELRRSLAAYLARARGVVTTPGRIVVCASFTNGLSLVAQALQWQGVTAMAMEDPCLPQHRMVVRGHGLRVAPVPVDGAGADPAALAAGDAGAVLVTPAHQYPTGVTLQPARRAAFVAWARTHGGLVVEDDYDGEFRYDRQPVGALQGLAPDHVVYAGTASKTVAPGVRLGWLVVPEHMLDAVVAAHRLSGASPPAMDQLVLAQLLERGQVDRHLRRLRAGYRRQRDLLLDAVRRFHPDIVPTGVAAGLHIVLELASTTEDAVRDAAEARQVGLGYLGPHVHRRSGRRHRQGVVVGYARQPPTAFPRALRQLAAVLDAAR